MNLEQSTSFCHRLLVGAVFCAMGCLIATASIAQQPVETESDADNKNLWTRNGLDWPAFLGPERNGKSRETGIRFNWSEKPPQLVWEQRVGEGYGIGAVANGRYFHFDRVGDLARLRAFHAETGKSLWEFTYPTDYVDQYGFDGGPRSSPVVDDDRVYILGVEGMLHCLNCISGERIWDINTAERFAVIQNHFGVGSTPLINNDLLIAMIGGSPRDSENNPSRRLDRAEPNGSGIVAFDKLTGEIRYQAVDDLASYASPVIFKIEDKMIGLALCREGLTAFDPDTGESGERLDYRARKYESVNASTPVLTDSGILITESYGPGGALLKFGNQSFSPVWADAGGRDLRLACHWNTPVEINGYAYASSGEKRATATLRCVRVADGQVMWEEPGLGRSSLTLVDGHLICLTEEGRLFNFVPDPGGFRIHSEYPVNELRLLYPCWASPIVSHGFLYVLGKSRVICLDISE